MIGAVRAYAFQRHDKNRNHAGRKAESNMNYLGAIVFAGLLACLPACGTVRSSIEAARMITVSLADDAIAAVDGVSDADWERRHQK